MRYRMDCSSLLAGLGAAVQKGSIPGYIHNPLSCFLPPLTALIGSDGHVVCVREERYSRRRRLPDACRHCAIF